MTAVVVTAAEVKAVVVTAKAAKAEAVKVVGATAALVRAAGMDGGGGVMAVEGWRWGGGGRR